VWLCGEVVLGMEVIVVVCKSYIYSSIYMYI